MKFNSLFLMAYLEKKYSTAFARVSSHDRNHGVSHQFTITNSINNSAATKEVRAIQVINVSMPNTFYNVSRSTNFFKYVDGNGALWGFTITPGVYTRDQFYEAIIAQNSIFQTIDVNPVTRKVTCTFTDINVTGVVSFQTSPDVDVNPIAYLLGFDQEDVITFNGTGTTIAPSLMHLNEPEVVYINCPELSISKVYDFKDNTRNAADVLVAVPMDKSFGEVVHYAPGDNLSSLMEFNAPRFVTELHFSLTDKWGKLLHANGGDWSITFKLFYQMY